MSLPSALVFPPCCVHRVTCLKGLFQYPGVLFGRGCLTMKSVLNPKALFCVNFSCTLTLSEEVEVCDQDS